MTIKLVDIINSLKLPKIKKMLLYEIKFLVPNYRCLQNPWLGGYRPQIPDLSVLCPQLNLLNPPTPTRTKFLGTPLTWLSEGQLCSWMGRTLFSVWTNKSPSVSAQLKLRHVCPSVRMRQFSWNLILVIKQSSTFTGLDRLRGFQKVEAPRFQDNRHMKAVRLPAPRTGRLYPQ